MIKLLLLLGLVAVGWKLFRPGGRTMTPADAEALLGVGPHDGPARIREAHRRLMQRVHPDVGGTHELAARINHARDTLLAVARHPETPRG